MRLEPNIILIALPLIVPFSSHHSFSPFMYKWIGNCGVLRFCLFTCSTRLWARSLFLPSCILLSLLLWLPFGVLGYPTQTPKGLSYLLSLIQKEQAHCALILVTQISTQLVCYVFSAPVVQLQLHCKFISSFGIMYCMNLQSVPFAGFLFCFCRVVV